MLESKSSALPTWRYPNVFYGMPAGIRTPDPRLRRAMLYPAELQTHKFLERVKGIEPSQLAWKARALPLSYTRVFFRLHGNFNLLFYTVLHGGLSDSHKRSDVWFSTYTTELHPHGFA